MHRALLVPEIVATIVKSGSGYRGFLHNCLLTNHLFFIESARLLWYGCGTRYNDATAGHATPDICHLAHVSQQNGRRAQVYANFIHILTFAEPADTYPYGDEAQWHGDLACLQFPGLQEVSFYESDHAATLNRGDVVIHYAQPNVEVFCLRNGSSLSDSFLGTLYLRCPKLRNVHLGTSSENTITRGGLLRFLRRAVSLESLVTESGFEELWSQDGFRAIEQYPNLRLLKLPAIRDEWIDQYGNLDLLKLRHVFPALKHLYTSASSQGLELLQRYVPNLSTLNIRFQGSCTTISAATGLTQLKDLTLEFDENSSFDDSELLLLVQSCPKLAEITLAEDGYNPRIIGLNDDMMDTIAHHLFSIKILCLKVDTRKPITLRSIRSLGRYCPKLEDLTLYSIAFDWDELSSRHEEDVISTRIWAIEVALHDDQPLLPHNEPYEEDPANSDHIAELASNFAHLFPKLMFFTLTGGGAGEERFADKVGDICLDRY